jgi:carbon monoxide dehydrogenase subunit G
MASIRREFAIEAPAEKVWDAVRDVGAAHRRLFPGVLTDVCLDGDARIVTFANGLVVREAIVDLDDETRRFAWTASGGRLTHHHASMQVFAEGERRSRLLWVTDLLPNELHADIAALVDAGTAALMKALCTTITREACP